MDERLRHKKAFRFFGKFLPLLVKWLLNYTCDDLSNIKGPYILLSNHNTDLDPVLVGTATKNQLYFVASEHIMRGGLATTFIMRYFKPIIHTKGKLGLSSTMEMLKTLKRGDNVCLFPEGNRSFNGVTCDIPEVTGRLVKRTGASLVTFRIEGGYFTQPRWGLSLRRGKMRGRLINVYTPDMLKNMSNEEVNAAIVHDLSEDAYATQERENVKFRGSRLAKGLESAVFTCPLCRKIGTLHTDNKSIFCGCGFKSKFDKFGILTDGNGEKRTITEWDAWQRGQLRELTEKNTDEELFADDVTINRIGDNHAVEKQINGRLSAYGKGFQFGDRFIPADELEGTSIYSRNVLVAHIGGNSEQYEIRGTKSFCALKYLYLYNYLRVVK